MFTAGRRALPAFLLLGAVGARKPALARQERAGRLRPAVLARIGGEAYAARETASIKATLAAEEIARVRFADLLEPRMVRILLIGCGLAVLQQWSGINVLFNYAENIFKQAGFGVSTILLFIVITGVVNAAFTFIALADRGPLGPAQPHVVGLRRHCPLAPARSAWPIAQAQRTGRAALFARGHWLLRHVPGPVTWVLISEIFPNRIRGAAISVAVSAFWIACFILTYTFPLLERAIGTGKTFWLYSAICLAGFVFVYLYVPETKGKSLEQIERETSPRRRIGLTSC